MYKYRVCENLGHVALEINAWKNLTRRFQKWTPSKLKVCLLLPSMYMYIWKAVIFLGLVSRRNNDEVPWTAVLEDACVLYKYPGFLLSLCMKYVPSSCLKWLQQKFNNEINELWRIGSHSLVWSCPLLPWLTHLFLYCRSNQNVKNIALPCQPQHPHWEISLRSLLHAHFSEPGSIIEKIKKFLIILVFAVDV